MKTPREHEVDYYYGDDDRAAVLWHSAHILDSNLSENPIASNGMPHAIWYDEEERLCDLSTQVVANSHFVHYARKEYGKARYIFTRTEPDDSTRFTFVIASDRKRIEQRDKNGKPLPRGQRIAEAVLLGSILKSYDAFDYDEILQSYSDVNGINEEAEFNEIVYHYERDTRLRRIGRRIRSLVGDPSS